MFAAEASAAKLDIINTYTKFIFFYLVKLFMFLLTKLREQN